MKTCEFCNEFSSYPNSKFGKTYKDEKIINRIVANSINFVVLPTIAQLVPNSYLVLPKKHYETYAQVPSEYYDELLSLVCKIEQKLNKNVILFEHGAKSCTDSGCGIYHAHIHIVPINSDFDYSQLVGEDAKRENDFHKLMYSLSQSPNYIFYRENNGNYFYNTLCEHNRGMFISQYFRRWLHKKFQLNNGWNWNDYNFVEKSVLDAIENMK